jgi:allophanate hydrolase
VDCPNVRCLAEAAGSSTRRHGSCRSRFNQAPAALRHPIAVNDNIDVAGLPTTAACPAFAYTPSETAPIVRQLLSAGALLVGKTNLDQFAAGLVGTRSPYGVPRNPFDARYIPGGSSSGSAVAVAAGLVSFRAVSRGRSPPLQRPLVGRAPARNRGPS